MSFSSHSQVLDELHLEGAYILELVDTLAKPPYAPSNEYSSLLYIHPDQTFEFLDKVKIVQGTVKTTGKPCKGKYTFNGKMFRGILHCPFRNRGLFRYPYGINLTNVTESQLKAGIGVEVYSGLFSFAPGGRLNYRMKWIGK